MSDRLPKQKKLISISEAAIFLGVSIDTIRRWDRSGVLHSERPDGKNRYFSVEDLEKHKSSQPLSISEVARKFNISATTLRRLESRGLIKPNRNSAGERVFDKESVEKFFSNDYFRKKQNKEKVLEPEQKGKEPQERNVPTSQPSPVQNQIWQVRSNVGDFVAISIAVFVLLVTVGTGNVVLSQTNVPQLPSPIILSETREPKIENKPEQILGTKEEATSEAELKEIKLVRIKSDSLEVNIRKEPTTHSEKFAKAKDGETFELVTKIPGWYEIKLSNGSNAFVSDTYAVLEEVTNE